MTDNFTWEESATGIEFASDDIGGVHYQYIKLAYGIDGSYTLVDASAPLPVENVAGIAGYDNDDAAVTAWPVTIGGRAYAVVPTAVDADGDAVYAWFDRAGRLMVGNRATPRTPINYKAAFSASQTAATVYTPTTGKKLCVTHLVVSASGAGAVYLFDDSDTAANAWSPTLNLAANGGWEAHFSDENPLVMSAVDNVLLYTSGVGAAGSIWLHGWEE